MEKNSTPEQKVTKLFFLCMPVPNYFTRVFLHNLKCPFTLSRHSNPQHLLRRTEGQWVTSDPSIKPIASLQPSRCPLEQTECLFSQCFDMFVTFPARCTVLENENATLQKLLLHALLVVEVTAENIYTWLKILTGRALTFTWNTSSDRSCYYISELATVFQSL